MEKTVKIRYLTLRTGIATFEFVMKTVFFFFPQGYNHSYYFIASFVEDHIRHHARYLNA